MFAVVAEALAAVAVAGAAAVSVRGGGGVSAMKHAGNQRYCSECRSRTRIRHINDSYIGNCTSFRSVVSYDLHQSKD